MSTENNEVCEKQKQYFEDLVDVEEEKNVVIKFMLEMTIRVFKKVDQKITRQEVEKTLKEF